MAATKLSPRLALALLLAATAWVYAPVRAHPFVDLDDPEYVTRNLDVLGGPSLDGLRWAVASGHAGNWHPLTWISHQVDVALWGAGPGDAGGHHATSVALHLFATALCWAAWRALGLGAWPALGIAAAFALHPLHVESVAWVSERKDVLSGVFALASLWAWARFARRGGAARYAFVALLLALGLGSKPMLVTWPFVLLLVDVWPLGRLRGGPGPAEGGPAPRPRGAGALLLEKAPLLALCALSSVVTYAVQRAGGAMSAGLAIPLVERVENALVAYALYLVKAVWPGGLAAFYPHPALGGGGWSAGAVAGAAALLVLVTAAAIALFRRAPYVLVGWLVYLGTLVPVIGLVQVGAQSHADRYTYLPLLGPFAAVAAGCAALARARAGARVPLALAAVLVLAALGVQARRQVATWRSTEALAERALAVTEGNWNALAMLGGARRDERRWAEAERLFREVVRLCPQHAAAWNELGLALVEQGRWAEAEPALREALARDPSNRHALANLGRGLALAGRTDEAIAALERAVELDPRFADGLANLGVTLAGSGRPDLALEPLRAALRWSPPDPRRRATIRFNLGLALLSTGEEGAAAEQLQASLREDPTHERADVARGLLEQLGRGP